MMSYYMHQNAYNLKQIIYNIPPNYNPNSNTFQDNSKHSFFSNHNPSIHSDFDMSNNPNINQSKYNILYNMQDIGSNFFYMDPNVHSKNINITGHVDTSELSYISDNLIKEKDESINNFSQKNYEQDLHDKEEDELVNELQSLSKRKSRSYDSNKTPNYSPVFPGSPIGIGSPFMGRTTPFFLSHGNSSPKNF